MKILLAEDDQIFRILITEMLTPVGYEVISEENGRSAWERLQVENFDMVILDVEMPEMNGFELLRLIRSDARFTDMPVLMLTVIALHEDQIQGLTAGADDYVTKPFTNDVFMAKLKAIARRIPKKQL